MEELMTLKKIQETVKVGTEFTFRIPKDKMFEFNIFKEGSDKNTKMFQIYQLYIIPWEKAIMAKKTFGSFTMEVKKITDDNNLGTGHMAFKYKAIKVEVNFYDRHHGPFNWYFWINFDSNCIELQTAPLTYNQFVFYKPAIEWLIFICKGDRLIADPDPIQGGGGHISLDKSTTFGVANPDLHLRNFMVSYMNELKNPLVTKCADVINAPFITELANNAIVDFNAIIHEFDDESNKKMKTLDDLVKAINERVYNVSMHPNPALRMFSIEIKAEDYPHYQAINLEHMLKKGDDARIEMRRYNAQGSVDQLLVDLNFLNSLLVRS